MLAPLVLVVALVAFSLQSSVARLVYPSEVTPSSDWPVKCLFSDGIEPALTDGVSVSLLDAQTESTVQVAMATSANLYTVSFSAPSAGTYFLEASLDGETLRSATTITCDADSATLAPYSEQHVSASASVKISEDKEWLARIADDESLEIFAHVGAFWLPFTSFTTEPDYTDLSGSAVSLSAFSLAIGDVAGTPRIAVGVPTHTQGLSALSGACIVWYYTGCGWVHERTFLGTEVDAMLRSGTGLYVQLGYQVFIDQGLLYARAYTLSDFYDVPGILSASFNSDLGVWNDLAQIEGCEDIFTSPYMRLASQTNYDVADGVVVALETGGLSYADMEVCAGGEQTRKTIDLPKYDYSSFTYFGIRDEIWDSLATSISLGVVDGQTLLAVSSPYAAGPDHTILRGRVRIYDLSRGGWSPIEVLPNTQPDDVILFGSYIHLEADTLVAGYGAIPSSVGETLLGQLGVVDGGVGTASVFFMDAYEYPDVVYGDGWAQYWIPYSFSSYGDGLAVVSVPEETPTLPAELSVNVLSTEPFYECEYPLVTFELLQDGVVYTDYDLSNAMVVGDISYYNWDSNQEYNPPVTYDTASGVYTLEVTHYSCSDTSCHAFLFPFQFKIDIGPRLDARANPDSSHLLAPLYKEPGTHVLVKALWENMCGNEVTTGTTSFELRSTTSDYALSASVTEAPYYTQFDGSDLPADTYTITATFDSDGYDFDPLTSTVTVSDDLDNIQLLRGKLTSALIVGMNSGLIDISFAQMQDMPSILTEIWDFIVSAEDSGAGALFLEDLLTQFAALHGLDLDDLVSSLENLEDADVSMRLGGALGLLNGVEYMDYMGVFNTSGNDLLDSAFDSDYYLPYQVEVSFDDMGRKSYSLVAVVDGEGEPLSDYYTWYSQGGLSAMLEYLDTDVSFWDGLLGILTYVDDMAGAEGVIVDTYAAYLDQFRSMPEDYTVGSAFNQLVDRLDEDGEEGQMSVGDIVDGVSDLIGHLAQDTDLFDGINHILAFIDTLADTHMSQDYTDFMADTDTSLRDFLAELVGAQDMDNLDSFLAWLSGIASADGTVLEGIQSTLELVRDLAGITRTSSLEEALDYVNTLFADLDGDREYLVRSYLGDLVDEYDTENASHYGDDLATVESFINALAANEELEQDLVALLSFIDEMAGTSLSGYYANMQTWLDDLEPTYTLADALQDLLTQVDEVEGTDILAAYNEARGVLDDVADADTLLNGLVVIVNAYDLTASFPEVAYLQTVTDFINGLDDTYTVETGLDALLDYIDKDEEMGLVSIKESVLAFISDMTDPSFQNRVDTVLTIVDTYTGLDLTGQFDSLVTYLDTLPEDATVADCVHDLLDWVETTSGMPLADVWDQVVALVDGMPADTTLADGIGQVLDYVDETFETSLGEYFGVVADWLADLSPEYTIHDAVYDVAQYVQDNYSVMLVTYFTSVSTFVDNMTSAQTVFDTIENLMYAMGPYLSEDMAAQVEAVADDLSAFLSGLTSEYTLSEALDDLLVYIDDLQFGTDLAASYQSVKDVANEFLADASLLEGLQTLLSVLSDEGVDVSDVSDYLNAWVDFVEGLDEAYTVGVYISDSLEALDEAYDMTVSLSESYDAMLTFLEAMSVQDISLVGEAEAVLSLMDGSLGSLILYYTDNGDDDYVPFTMSDLVADIDSALAVITDIYTVQDAVNDVFDLIGEDLGASEEIDAVRTDLQTLLAGLATDEDFMAGLTDLAIFFDEIAGDTTVEDLLQSFEDLGADYTVLDAVEALLADVDNEYDTMAGDVFDDLLALIKSLAEASTFMDGIDVICECIDKYTEVDSTSYLTEIEDWINGFAADYTLGDALEDLAAELDLDEGTSLVEYLDDTIAYLQALNEDYYLPDELMSLLTNLSDWSSVLVNDVIAQAMQWIQDEVLQGFTFADLLAPVNDWVQETGAITVFSIRDDVVDYITTDLGFTFSAVFGDIQQRLDSFNAMLVEDILDEAQQSIREATGVNLPEAFSGLDASLSTVLDTPVEDYLSQFQDSVTEALGWDYASVMSAVSDYFTDVGGLSLLDIMQQVDAEFTDLAGATISEVFNNLQTTLSEYGAETVQGVIDRVVESIEDNTGITLPATMDDLVTIVTSYTDDLASDVIADVQQIVDDAFNGVDPVQQLFSAIDGWLEPVLETPVLDYVNTLRSAVTDETGTYADIMATVMESVEGIEEYSVQDLVDSVRGSISQVIDDLDMDPTLLEVITQVAEGINAYLDTPLLDISDGISQAFKDAVGYDFVDGASQLWTYLDDTLASPASSIAQDIEDRITQAVGDSFSFADIFSTVDTTLGEWGAINLYDTMVRYTESINSATTDTDLVAVSTLLRGGKVYAQMQGDDASTAVSVGVALGGTDWHTSVLLSIDEGTTYLYFPTTAPHDDFSTVTCASPNLLVGDTLEVEVVPLTYAGTPQTGDVEVLVSVMRDSTMIESNVQLTGQDGVYTQSLVVDTEGVYTVTARVAGSVLSNTATVYVGKVMVEYGGREFYLSESLSVVEGLLDHYAGGDTLTGDITLVTASGSTVTAALPVTAAWDMGQQQESVFQNPKHAVSVTVPSAAGYHSLDFYVDGQLLTSSTTTLTVAVDAYGVAFVSDYAMPEGLGQTCGSSDVSFTLEDYDMSTLSADLSASLSAGWDGASDLSPVYSDVGTYTLTVQSPTAAGTHYLGVQVDGVVVDTRSVTTSQVTSAGQSSVSVPADVVIGRTASVSVTVADACGSVMPAGSVVTVSVGYGESLPSPVSGVTETSPGVFTAVTDTLDMEGDYTVSATADGLALPSQTITVHPLPVSAPTSSLFLWDEDHDGLFLSFPSITLSGDLTSPLACSALLDIVTADRTFGDALCSVESDGVTVLVEDSSDFKLHSGDSIQFVSEAPLLPYEVIAGETVLGLPMVLDGTFTVDYSARDMPTARVDPNDSNIKLPLLPCGSLSLDVHVNKEAKCDPLVQWSTDGTVYTPIDTLVIELGDSMGTTSTVYYTVETCFSLVSGQTTFTVRDPVAPMYTLPSSALVSLGDSITFDPSVSLGCYWAAREEDLTMEWTVPPMLQDYTLETDTVLEVDADSTITQGSYDLVFSLSGEGISDETTVTLVVDGDVSLSVLTDWPDVDSPGYLGANTDLLVSLVSSDETAVDMSAALWELDSSDTHTTATGASASFADVAPGTYELTVTVKKVSTQADLSLASVVTVLEAPTISTYTLTGSEFDQSEEVALTTTGALNAFGVSIDLNLWAYDTETGENTVPSRVVDSSAELYIPQSGEFDLYLGACDRFRGCTEESVGVVTIKLLPPPAADEDVTEAPIEEQMAMVASLGAGEQDGAWAALDEETRVDLAATLTASILGTEDDDEEEEEEEPDFTDVMLVVGMGNELTLDEDTYDDIANVVADVIQPLNQDQASSLVALADNVQDPETSKDLGLVIGQQLAAGLERDSGMSGPNDSATSIMTVLKTSDPVEIESREFSIISDSGAVDMTSGLGGLSMPKCSLRDGLVGCNSGYKTLVAETDTAMDTEDPAETIVSRRVSVKGSVFLGVTEDTSAVLDDAYTLTLGLLTGAADVLADLFCVFDGEDTAASGCSAALSSDGTAIECTCTTLGTIAAYSSIPEAPADTFNWVPVALGGAGVLSLLGVGTCCCVRRKSNKKAKAKAQMKKQDDALNPLAGVPVPVAVVPVGVVERVPLPMAVPAGGEQVNVVVPVAPVGRF
ncbi:hypothetical protein KIPB_003550 [Kipferlia bialata]|uniref:Ig-like domain-containing protein n=1 Tax=Kipferlia bialata TaxID=797122 RepID=A0A391NVF3_9EUKA|nr:hypothetical protein KIPB_003550 [Kipferlia bialata]|eukprot:g3550.t1